MKSFLVALTLSLGIIAGPTLAQSTGPLKIEITEGVIEPMPFAAPAFVAESAAVGGLAEQITAVVIADLVGSGIFREVPARAHVAVITNFDSPVQFSDWKVINVQALITGAVTMLSLIHI